MIYTIDIETKPDTTLPLPPIEAPKNYKNQDKIDEYVSKQQETYQKKMATDVDYATIVLVGIKADDQETQIYRTPNEIETAFRQIVQDKQHTIVTFNGSAFDLPCLMRWGIRQGLDLPYSQMKEWTRRYNERHIDIFERMGGIKGGKSLATYSQIYLSRKTPEIDFLACSDQELVDHCVDDVDTTYNLYKKLETILV